MKKFAAALFVLFAFSSISFQASAQEGNPIYSVPNSLTPDGDEYMKEFKPVFTSGVNPLDYSFIIFNRWGEKVFETTDLETGWDGTFNGKMVQDGTYTWSLEFKLVENGESQRHVGHVNVLR